MVAQASLLAPTDQNISYAAQLLGDGKLVAFATETVYGLGANGYSEQAVRRIYEAKSRPAINPLIHHFADVTEAFAHAKSDFPLKQEALKVAAKFSPGPLTFILPVGDNTKLTSVARAGLETFAARIPNNEIALNLLKATQFPIVAPSANPSGKVSPTLASHVVEHLGDKIDAVLDGGKCSCGVESTIVDFSGDEPTILREGAITKEMIEAILALHMPNVTNTSPLKPKAPGALTSHYSPSIPVLLEQSICNPDEAFLAFGSVPEAIQGHPYIYNLSASEDLDEAASNLYSALHDLDKLSRKKHLKRIRVMPIPSKGIGCAINDRLSRAAADKGKLL